MILKLLYNTAAGEEHYWTAPRRARNPRSAGPPLFSFEKTNVGIIPVTKANLVPRILEQVLYVLRSWAVKVSRERTVSESLNSFGLCIQYIMDEIPERIKKEIVQEATQEEVPKENEKRFTYIWIEPLVETVKDIIQKEGYEKMPKKVQHVSKIEEGNDSVGEESKKVPRTRSGNRAKHTELSEAEVQDGWQQQPKKSLLLKSINFFIF